MDILRDTLTSHKKKPFRPIGYPPNASNRWNEAMNTKARIFNQGNPVHLTLNQITSTIKARQISKQSLVFVWHYDPKVREAVNYLVCTSNVKVFLFRGMVKVLCLLLLLGCAGIHGSPAAERDQRSSSNVGSTTLLSIFYSSHAIYLGSGGNEKGLEHDQ